MAQQTTVFVVGGFFATDLNLNPFIGPTQKVWVDKAFIALNLLDPMDLAPDGLSPGPLAGKPLFVNDWTIPAYYDPMYQQLTNDGYFAIAVRYDWRLSYSLLAAKLFNLILGADNSGPWAAVVHSGGSFGFMLAWSQLIAAKGGSNCKRVVWCDPCIGGSYDAAVGLAGGFFDGLGFGLLTQLLSAVVRPVFNPLHVYPAQNNRLKQVIAHWPGMYELLPSNSGRFAFIDTNANSFYNAGNWTTNPYVTQSALNAAMVNQVLVASALNGPMPPSVRVVGPQKQTINGLANPGVDWDGNGAYSNTSLGDGVIPYTRSVIPGANTLTVNNDHASVVADPQLLALIGPLIESGLGSASTTPAPVLPASPANTTVDVKTIGAPAFPATASLGDP